MEEEEDYEAFEMRQKAAMTAQDHEQDMYDREHGNRDDLSDGGFGDEADELARATDNFDDDLAGDQYTTTSEKGASLGNLGKTKLSQNDYMKRA